MEERKRNKRKIYQAKHMENNQCDASSSQHRSVQNDKTYEGIR